MCTKDEIYNVILHFVFILQIDETNSINEKVFLQLIVDNRNI